MNRKYGIIRKLLPFIIALVLLLYILNFREMNLFSLFRDRRKMYRTNMYIINTTGCKIPDLDVYDDEIMDLLGGPGQYSCGDLPPLVISNRTSLSVDLSVLDQYGVSDISEVKCKYIPFWRVDPKGDEEDNEVAYGEEKYFESSIQVEEEFVKVECEYRGNLYKDFHSFVPIKKAKKYPVRAVNDKKLNVIIMGTDSISRLHFHRMMPETAKYLLKELKAVELMGYNKLADNTFPNLIPVLTGYSFHEIIHECWPSYKHKFDNCSFVWQNYSKAGYVTSFAEEKTTFGLFNYLKTGWYKQPTDYYWRSFDYTALEESGHYYDLLHTYPMCMGPRPMFKVLLNHVDKFIESMKDKYFFSFMWVTTLTHDNYDTPALAENDYIKHLKFLKESGALNNSILIFLSDHGYRFGKFARTHQGHLEERLPYVFLVVPPWFHEKYPVAVSNMKENAFHLTTPYDLHATLNHILHPEELSDQKVRKAVPNQRSISLFRPIPLERTCESADIPMHWCTCQETYPVDNDDPIVKSVAEYAVDYMNYLLKNASSCEKLRLSEITRANLAKYGDANHELERTTSDYFVSFKTTPGEGWFDTTIRCTFCDGYDFKISGSISRLTRYGNTSHCINDFNLKLYCYCKDQLKIT